MAGWYSAGTVTVTNGGTVVTGAGTDFVRNVTAGDAFALVGSYANEIASVQSATQLTLARPWLGATGAGQAYVIIPTVGIYVDLALRALNMLTPFQAVLDGVGQGLFGDGNSAAPGMRFAADQDTGIARYGSNILGLVSGGVPSLFASQGSIGIGTTSPLARMHVTTNAAEPNYVLVGNPANGVGIGVQASGLPSIFGYSGTGLVFGTNLATTPTEFARFDGSGNLLVGVTSAPEHTITKSANQGSAVLRVRSNIAGGLDSFVVAGVNSYSPNGAGAAVYFGSNTNTGRSINAGGTINASGADYAEYIRKALNCGTILKGDVCGIDRNGELVRTWADAVRFVVKSTDPNLVGGDTWAAHLPPRPEAPGDAPSVPIAPAPSSAAVPPAEPIREDGEDDQAFIQRMAAYLVAAAAAVTAQQADVGAVAAYRADVATYPQRKAEHDVAVAAYDAALSAWEADLETVRQTVDRIAFCGQVPVNVDANTLAACEAALADSVGVYLVAVARGGGIGATAIRENDMTLPLYMRRIGAVWAIRDGRPWVDVQHG